jgi:hypothetical protein
VWTALPPKFGDRDVAPTITEVIRTFRHLRETLGVRLNNTFAERRIRSTHLTHGG